MIRASTAGRVRLIRASTAGRITPAWHRSPGGRLQHEQALAGLVAALALVRGAIPFAASQTVVDFAFTGLITLAPWLADRGAAVPAGPRWSSRGRGPVLPWPGSATCVPPACWSS
ncbi:hypothetical protein [Nonomuraea harbinensis]|uniref:Uncharacterized protein n=1 Tax=Nonomuraea harbinensis TaxID=1286938 RepID=A0ABW1BKE3_9ACTN|nr:hypothetical protein [Nonomuraea harbinensis]